MTRVELIQELRKKGIDRIYGRALSRCTKAELESYYNRLSQGQIIPHLSFAQINMYLRCGMQYFYRYVMGIKLPPPGAVVLGRVAHTIIEQDYKEKKEKGKNKSLSEKLDMFVETFREDIKEADLREDEKPEEMEYQGVNILTAHHREIALVTEPVEVEMPFEIEFENKYYMLKGKIDLISLEGIIDNKIASKKFSQIEIESDIQLPIYSFATGIPNVGFDIVIKTKNPKIQKIRSIIDKSKCARVKAYIAKVAEAIEKQIFLPAQPGTWVCSPKWCGYWDMCHKDLI